MELEAQRGKGLVQSHTTSPQPTQDETPGPASQRGPPLSSSWYTSWPLRSLPESGLWSSWCSCLSEAVARAGPGQGSITGLEHDQIPQLVHTLAFPTNAGRTRGPCDKTESLPERRVVPVDGGDRASCLGWPPVLCVAPGRSQLCARPQCSPLY